MTGEIIAGAASVLALAFLLWRLVSPVKEDIREMKAQLIDHEERLRGVEVTTGQFRAFEKKQDRALEKLDKLSGIEAIVKLIAASLKIEIKKE